MTSQEFANTYGNCDQDWVIAASGRDIRPLTPGQRGTYSGFDAAVIRHYANGMYEIRLARGVACVSGSEFVPA